MFEGRKNGSNDFLETFHVCSVFRDLSICDVIIPKILSGDVIIEGRKWGQIFLLLVCKRVIHQSKGFLTEITNLFRYLHYDVIT